MRNTTAPLPENSQPPGQNSKPPIRIVLELLYSQVTSPNYTHDANPWSDSDPGLQPISTASLELLQEHADFHMQSFLYIHELLDRELINRKLASRTRLDRVSSRRSPLGVSNLCEVLFDVEELEPLSAFLGQRDNSDSACSSMFSERIDAMAKMAYAWVDSDRSASSGCRRRTDLKTRLVKSQGPCNAAVEARVDCGDFEDAEKAGHSYHEDQFVRDVLELEAEMDEFDRVEDGESFWEIQSTISSVDSTSPLLGRTCLGEDEASVGSNSEADGPEASVHTEYGARKWWLRWLLQ